MEFFVGGLIVIPALLGLLYMADCRLRLIFDEQVARETVLACASCPARALMTDVCAALSAGKNVLLQPEREPLDSDAALRAAMRIVEEGR